MSLFEDATTPAFDDLVGEGKKYKSPEDVAKAVVEKDRFIERLKSEQEELRKELSTRPVVDRSQEILDRLENLNREAVTERPPITPEPERIDKGLSLDDVEKVLIDRERRARSEANILFVKEKLKEAFGDKYGQALKSIAEKNNLSEKALNDLAAQSPQLILNLAAQPSHKESMFVPPENSGNPSFTPSAGGAKPLSYYNQLRATDRNKYFSQTVQQQMYKDGMTLKEAFYDV